MFFFLLSGSNDIQATGQQKNSDIEHGIQKQRRLWTVHFGMPLGIRITTSRLHRAFVELDRFSDEKCLKFVRAAQGGFVLRCGLGILLLLMFVVIAGGLVGGAIALYLGVGGTFDERMISGSQRVWLNVGILAGSAISLLIAGFSTLFARDLWLRGRIRYVLDMRGRCSKCHYGLLGLPISDLFEVKCPECGATTKVDPALAVLAGEADRSGARRLVSKEEIEAPEQNYFWTTQRRRFVAVWFKRAAIGTVVCIGLLIAAALGWEAFIRIQASSAAKMKPGAAALQQFVESKQPVAYSADQDAWATLVSAIERVNKSDMEFRDGTMLWPTFTKSIKATNSQTEVWDATQGRMIQPGEDVMVEKTRELYPEFIQILNPPKDGDEFEDAFNKEVAELGRTMIEKYEKDGLFDLLRKMPGQKWAVKPLHLNADEPAINILLPELGSARQLARIEVGRIDLALAAGDVDKAIDAFEELMALQRVIGQQCSMINRLVSHAICSLTTTRAADIAVKADARQLARLEAIMQEQRTAMTTADALESERLGAVDTISWVFSDPKRVRFGKYSPGIADFYGGVGSGMNAGQHLGFLNENIEALNSYYEQSKKMSTLTKSQQTKQPAALPANLGLVNLMASATGRFFDTERLRSQQETAVAMMFAGYRFKGEKGKFPSSRAELEAFTGKPFPIDAMTEMPFELLKLDPAKDTFGRGFYIYSVGPDGVDNGGVKGQPNAIGSSPAFMYLPSGSDFIFFDPEDK